MATYEVKTKRLLALHYLAKPIFSVMTNYCDYNKIGLQELIETRLREEFDNIKSFSDSLEIIIFWLWIESINKSQNFGTESEQEFMVFRKNVMTEIKLKQIQSNDSDFDYVVQTLLNR